MGGIRGRTGWVGTVLAAPDPMALAGFYAALLGGKVTGDATFATVRLDDLPVYLACQLEPGHRPPVWPLPDPGDQQMQVHLDIGVRDLDEAVADAVARGARPAGVQPQDDVRVLLDPAGHPFCLYLDT